MNIVLNRNKNKIIYRIDFKSYAWITELDNECALLEIIITDENYRNQGLAKELLKYIIYDLKNRNFKFMKLVVSPTKESPIDKYKLIDFYKSIGFIEYNKSNMLLEF